MFSKGNILILLLSIFSPLWGFANTQKPPVWITADASHVDKQQGIALFTGHVQITQGETKVQGQQVKIFFDKKNQVREAIVKGDLAKVHTFPQAGKPALDAKARIIKYFPSQHKIILQDHASAEQAGNLLKGPILIYNTQTQVLNTPATKAGRTTIIIQPKANSGHS